jgi:hypothetical protein
MSIELAEFIQAGGVRNTHFFNGRVLTADDLRAEQKANRQQRRQLGQAIGEGVAYGLEVRLAGASTAARPVLSVTKGLAINRNGEAIALTEDVNVTLVREAQAQAVEAGLFAECVPPQPFQSQSNFGFYIFTARPISRFEGRAVMVGLESNGIGAGCGSRSAAEGVKFLLIPMALNAGASASALHTELFNLAAQLDLQTAQLPQMTGAQATQLQAEIRANTSKLRNGMAHLCFGTEKLAGFTLNPFARAEGKSPYTEYGALDELRAAGEMTDCDAPLALIYWTNTGVQFVDMWAVRRQIIHRSANDHWPLPVSQRREVEGAAMFFQFRQQVEELIQANPNQSALASITATSYFRYLPPIGIIPLSGIAMLRGFDYPKFFENRVYRLPVFVEGGRIESLIRDALAYPPIDLSLNEMSWLYQVRESGESLTQNPFNPPQPYMIFANGHLPFIGEARFDLSRWNFSNYV